MQALAPLRRSLTALPTAARFGAWFFIVFSLAHLAWVLGVMLPEPDGLVTLYQTSVADETHRAWGLAYGGMSGLVLAVGQATLVLAATFATLTRIPRWRRRGHWVLMGWAALWMLGLVRLAQLDHQIDSFAQATLATLLFGCTAFRAFAPSRRTPPADAPPPAEPLFIAIAPVPPVETPDPAPATPGDQPPQANPLRRRLQRAMRFVHRRLLAAGEPLRRLVARGSDDGAEAAPPPLAGIRQACPRFSVACRRRLAAAGRRLGDRMARLEPSSTDAPA